MAVARTQPLVTIPAITRVSTRWKMRYLAKSLPKKAPGQAFAMTGPPAKGVRPSR